MRVLNTDAVSYHSKTPEKCLETAECQKKKKYLSTCLNDSRHFTPFFASMDLLIRVKVEAMLKCIASRLAQKWKDPYSCTCGYVKSKVPIPLVQATHRCIREARVPASHISVTRP